MPATRSRAFRRTGSSKRHRPRLGGLSVSLGPTNRALIAILALEWPRIGFGAGAVGPDVHGLLLALFLIFLPSGILGSVLDRLKPQRKVSPSS